MAESKRPAPLRPGIDYDLVNISLIGHDPVTGRTYEECSAEWKQWKDELQARIDSMPWWNLRLRLQNSRDLMIMVQRLGM